MSVYAERLRWVRENLRRPDGLPVDKRALSRVLGWPEQRWKNLEGQLPWGESSKLWVREGLLALVARTTLPEGAGQKLVAYVFGESKAKPWSEPPTWREGMCPESGRRPGRPRREDPTPEELAPVVRLEERVEAHDTVRRAQLDAILRTVASGAVDVETALDAVVDIVRSSLGPARRYHDKHWAHSGASA